MIYQADVVTYYVGPAAKKVQLTDEGVKRIEVDGMIRFTVVHDDGCETIYHGFPYEAHCAQKEGE